MIFDIAVLDMLFARDYTVNGTLVGIEGVKQAVQFLHAALSDISAESNELVAEDDKIVLRWTVRGKHTGDFMGLAATSKLVELQGINIYRVSDGKISANHEQTNVLEVIQRLKSDK
jgi:predicted ester cyclase